MNNINLFESSSSFESASGGTLNYPNTSLIKETSTLIVKQSAIEYIKFYVSDTYNGGSTENPIEYTAIKGMTWKEWCHSEYNIYGYFYDEGEWENESAIWIFYTEYPGVWSSGEYMNVYYPTGIGDQKYNEMFGHYYPFPPDVILENETYGVYHDGWGVGGGPA